LLAGKGVDVTEKPNEIGYGQTVTEKLRTQSDGKISFNDTETEK